MLKVFGSFGEADESFYSYLKRESDGYFYDTDDQTFKPFANLVDGEIDFVEDANLSGEYTWELNIPDGTYIVYTRRGDNDEFAADAKRVVIRYGQEVTLPKTFIDSAEVVEIDLDNDESEIDIIVEDC